MQVGLHWGSNGERHALFTLTEVLPWLMTASVLSSCHSQCLYVYNNVKQKYTRRAAGLHGAWHAVRGTAHAGHARSRELGVYNTLSRQYFAMRMCCALHYVVRHCTWCTVCKYRSKQPYWHVRKCCACTLSVWHSTCIVSCDMPS